MLVVLGLNSPLRQYFSLYLAEAPAAQQVKRWPTDLAVLNGHNLGRSFHYHPPIIQI